MSYELPSDPKIAAKVIEATSLETSKKMDRGLMGALFGSSSEKAGNLAGFVLIIFCAIFAGILFSMPDTQSISKKDAVTLVAGIISTILGFLFGRSSS